MRAGTIFLRSTCRVRRVRACPPRRWHPRPPQATTPRGSPGVQPRCGQPFGHQGAAPNIPQTEDEASPHPQRLRPVHHLAGGVAAQAGILLKKRSLCPGALYFGHVQRGAAYLAFEQTGKMDGRPDAEVDTIRRMAVRVLDLLGVDGCSDCRIVA